jgi:RNA polymerase sigma factor (sigma-70 family)
MVRYPIAIYPKTPEELERILVRKIDEFGLSDEVMAVCEIEKVVTIRDLYDLSAESLVATEFSPEQVTVLRKLLKRLGLKRRSPSELTPSQKAEVRRLVGREHRELLKTQKPGARNFREENRPYLNLLLSRDPVMRALARQMLMIINEPGVRSIAGTYIDYLKGAGRVCDYSVSFEDLISEGSLGVLRAAEEFDPRTGNEFFTYAIWWIRHRVRRFVTDSGIIRVPVHLSRKVSRLRKVLKKLPEGATEDEVCTAVCAEFGFKVLDYEAFREVVSGLEAIQTLHRLDSRPNVELGGVGDMYDIAQAEGTSDTETHINEGMFLGDLGESLEEASRAIGLSDRSQQILWLRFGFGGDNDITLEKVGEIYEISRERVRQLEGDSLKKLRAWNGWKPDQIKALFG